MCVFREMKEEKKKEKYLKGGLLFTNKNISMWTWTF
jgi:hypothetical protein